MLGRAKMKVRAFIFKRNFISHLVSLALLLIFACSIENTNSFHYKSRILNQFAPRLSPLDKLKHPHPWANLIFLAFIHKAIQPAFLTKSCTKITGLSRTSWQEQLEGTEKISFHPHSFVNNSVASKSC